MDGRQAWYGAGVPWGMKFMGQNAKPSLMDPSLVSLILIFVWRNSEPINWVGWTFRKALKEIALGIVEFKKIED